MLGVSTLVDRGGIRTRRGLAPPPTARRSGGRRGRRFWAVPSSPWMKSSVVPLMIVSVELGVSSFLWPPWPRPCGLNRCPWWSLMSCCEGREREEQGGKEMRAGVC